MSTTTNFVSTNYQFKVMYYSDIAATIHMPAPRTSKEITEFTHQHKINLALLNETDVDKVFVRAVMEQNNLTYIITISPNHQISITESYVDDQNTVIQKHFELSTTQLTYRQTKTNGNISVTDNSVQMNNVDLQPVYQKQHAHDFYDFRSIIELLNRVQQLDYTVLQDSSENIRKYVNFNSERALKQIQKTTGKSFVKDLPENTKNQVA